MPPSVVAVLIILRMASKSIAECQLIGHHLQRTSECFGDAIEKGGDRQGLLTPSEDPLSE